MNRFSTDLLRVLSAIFIIFNHTAWALFMMVGEGHGFPLAHLAAFINQLGKPSVLIFVFLSGFAFGKRHSKEPFRAVSFYINRAFRIVPLYVLVSLIAFLLYNRSTPENFFLSLLNGSAMYHLYFVAMILYFYLFFPLLRRIPFNATTALLFLFLLFAPMLYCLGYDLIALTGWSAEKGLFVAYWRNNEMIRLPVWWDRIFYALPFFQAGIWLGMREKKGAGTSDAVGIGGLVAAESTEGIWARLVSMLPEKPGRRKALALLLLVISFGLVVLHFYFQTGIGLDADTAGRVWRLPVALYAASWILLLSIVRPRMESSLLRRMARTGFIVYLIHPFFINLTKQAMEMAPYTQTLAVVILSWSSAFLLNELARKNRLAGFLLGDGDRVVKEMAVLPEDRALSGT